MRRLAFLRMSFLCLVLLSRLGFAETAPTAAIAHVPTPPEVTSEAYILVDFHSGKVLAEKDSKKRIDPASLTKMMSVFVVDHEIAADRLKLTDEVPISESAWKTEGSRMFVQAGKKNSCKRFN